MRRFLAGTLVMLALTPAIVRADSPVFVDSLAPQVFTLTPGGHQSVRREAVGAARRDALTENQRAVVLATLGGLETSCRTGLLPKDEEPGSPWLAWRPLARADVGETVWYVAALSCSDSLCGSRLVLHDRLALLAVGRERSRVLLLPPEPAAIGDEGSAVVDSADVIPGDGFTLVPVKRHLQSDHPCYDGGDYTATDQQFVLLLRGDSLVQSMVLTRREEWDSHDDVDGDQETYRRSALSIMASSIRMDYQVIERQHSPDGDESKTRIKVTQRGVVRVAYDKASGRFRRVQ